MVSTLTYIGNIFNGEPFAYIYIIFSKEHQFVYVGQTNQKYGTIGRLGEHIYTFGTLRERFREKIGLPLEQVKDLYLFSYCLGEEKMFTSLETTYREGLEYLVQCNLYYATENMENAFRIISNIRPNSTSSLSMIKSLATEITNVFISAYK